MALKLGRETGGSSPGPTRKQASNSKNISNNAPTAKYRSSHDCLTDNADTGLYPRPAAAGRVQGPVLHTKMRDRSEKPRRCDRRA